MNADQLPPALRCLLFLLRPHLADAELYQRHERAPWRLRFMVGATCHAVTIGRDESRVAAVAALIESWRCQPFETWHHQNHETFMQTRFDLLAALAGSDHRLRRALARLLHDAWAYNDPHALAVLLDLAGQVRAWTTCAPNCGRRRSRAGMAGSNRKMFPICLWSAS